MGNRQSTESHVLAPRSYYLVVGSPPIRFIGEPASRGPLIFNVETEQQGDDCIDRAETLQLRVAVPSKQQFQLKQVDAANKRLGFLLSFTLAMVEPGQSLRVFAGVAVRYCAGEGVQLAQAEKSQTPFCIFEIVSPEEFHEEIEVQDALLVHKLKKAVVAPDANGANRLTYAPIAIELVSRVPAPTTSPASGLETAENGGGVKNVNSRCEAATGAAAAATTTTTSTFQLMPSLLLSSSPQPPPPPPPPTVRMVQYTFLDIPDITLDQMQRSSSQMHDGAKGAAARPEYEAKVVRQLLQCGVEVYELDDVFEVDGGHEDISDADDEGGEEAVGICVICMAYPKDTTLLPCRHMCLCHECAGVLRFQQKSRCPICRTDIERFMTV